MIQGLSWTNTSTPLQSEQTCRGAGRGGGGGVEAKGGGTVTPTQTLEQSWTATWTRCNLSGRLIAAIHLRVHQPQLSLPEGCSGLPYPLRQVSGC
jgi:hypothetical protein